MHAGACKNWMAIIPVMHTYRECSADDDHDAETIKYEFDQVVLSQPAVCRSRGLKKKDVYCLSSTEHIALSQK